MTPADVARFIRYVTISPNGCWLWTGTGTAGGYGRFSLKEPGQKRKSYMAHRLSYEHAVSPIPAGLTIDHLCRQPSCVNPRHLEPVTQAENNARAELGWWWRNRDHCSSGHLYTKENTRILVRKSGARVRLCRICHRARVRSHRQRKRELLCLS